MEILVSIGSLLLACVLLAALAWIIWYVVEKTAKRNGYSKESMPIHYHIFGVGTYFTVLILLVWFR